MDEFPEDELTLPAEPVRHRLSWSAVVGAAFGLALGVVWARFGFAWALLGLVLAVVGGFMGRFYVGD